MSRAQCDNAGIPSTPNGFNVDLEEARHSGVGDLELLKDYPGISVFDLEAAWQYVETHPEEIDNAIRLSILKG